MKGWTFSTLFGLCASSTRSVWLFASVSRKLKRIHPLRYQNPLRNVFLLQFSFKSPALIEVDILIQESWHAAISPKEYSSRTNKFHQRFLNLIRLLQTNQDLTPITLKVRPRKLFPDRAHLRWQRRVRFLGARFSNKQRFKPSLQPPRQSISSLLLSMVHSIQREFTFTTFVFRRNGW